MLSKGYINTMMARSGLVRRIEEHACSGDGICAKRSTAALTIGGATVGSCFGGVRIGSDDGPGKAVNASLNALAVRGCQRSFECTSESIFGRTFL